MSEYEIGYGRPPKKTRFKPGESGNPKGRPKGTKNLKTDLIEELRERVNVREGEKSLRVSKQRAFVKSLVTRGIRGDGRASTSLLALMARAFDLADAPEVPDGPLSGDEKEVYEALVERIVEEHANQAGADADNGGADEGEKS